MEEKKFITSLKNGEEAAYSHLLDMYQHIVYNTVLNFVQHETDAEDVTQEVFITVFQSIRNFKEEAKLFTWIYRITINKSLELLKRKKRKKRFAFIEPIGNDADDAAVMIPGFNHPGVQLENKERAAILYAAIAKLQEQQRTAFILSQAEGLSYVLIAGIMDTTVPAVESLIFRSKKNLKMLLSAYYDMHK